MSRPQWNIWIFGGTGFIGQALLAHLRTDPGNRLHLLVHRNIPYRQLEDFNIFKGSITDFNPAWFQRYPPDVIFHLARPAGSSMITRSLAASQAQQANLRMINILNTLNLSPVIVYVSGSLMYGHQHNDDRVNEDAGLNPVSFARYYIKGELPWINAQQDGNLDIRFARPAWILGPSSWFREFYWKPYHLTGSIPCYGSGKRLMSITQLEDCAKMIDQLSKSEKRGRNLNIFSCEPVAQEEFSHLLADRLQCKVMPVSMKELKSKYGNAAASALQASIPLATLYPELHKQAGILYDNPQKIIDRTLSLLENEKGVFSKLP